MAHHKTPTGIVGWGPTAAELDHLAALFEQVHHVAFMHSGQAPMSSIPYRATNLVVVPVSVSGGTRIRDKIEILYRFPSYARTIWCEMNEADAVHVRCPAAISLLALILLLVRRNPKTRWVKYAGNWSPKARESWSYGFQRWFLRNNLHGGLVTVNGSWPNQPPHIHPFLNPSLEDDDLEQGRVAARQKTLRGTVQIVFAGRLEMAKGIGRALSVVDRLQSSGIPTHLHIFGDGPERERFRSQASELIACGATTFYGPRPRHDVFETLRQAHFVLLPSSSSEGWPKILSEGMCFGAIPLAGAVSTIPTDLERYGLGRAIDPMDVVGFAKAIEEYWRAPHVWALESQKGVRVAVQFSFAHYCAEVRGLLEV